VVFAFRNPLSPDRNGLIAGTRAWFGIVAIVAGLTGCGGSIAMNAVSTPVSISPASAAVGATGQLQFTATVAGTSDQAVSWQVDGVPGGNALVGTISSTGLYTAPDFPVLAIVSAESRAKPSAMASSYLAVRAQHSIAVRTTGEFAEFFDRRSGATFVPRGSNYIRRKNQDNTYGDVVNEHSTFSVGLYDASRVESALAHMQAGGYNVVRVWLSGCCEDSIGDEDGGLSQEYLANVTDFLVRAKNHSVYVVLTSNWVPKYGGYMQDYGGCSQFSYYNTLNLCAGGVRAARHFFHDLVENLLEMNAPMEAIFAFELRDDYYYDSDLAPLSWTSGTVTTANGQTYDMSSAASRQQMMDDGMVYFVDPVRATIRQLDPTALVDLNFFVPEGPNPVRVGNHHIIQAYPSVARSTADFVGIAPYPAALTLP